MAPNITTWPSPTSLRRYTFTIVLAARANREREWYVLLLEHVGAFGLLGFCIFVSYPEHPYTTYRVVPRSAVALELAPATV